MESYQNFVGIDIGKFNFVVSSKAEEATKEYANDPKGIATFFKDFEKDLTGSFCVLENTGGYEKQLLYALCGRSIPTHRADTRKVKSFIRSFGAKAKTDKLDAKALAQYAFERHEILEPFTGLSKAESRLFALVNRRNDLKGILVQEKNRLQSPELQLVKSTFAPIIRCLEKQITKVNDAIMLIIKGDKQLNKRFEILKTIPGIGDIVAFSLLTLLPELGKLDRRKIASLAGVAPRAYESGTMKGYRQTGHGRRCIKPLLFISAMAARNSKSRLKEFYEGLISRGKKKMQALTALMRKIIVIANAKIRDFYVID